MPEVAKCPCCGNEMLPLLTVTGCSYCAFECKLKDFPRISAAMELDELRERVKKMIDAYRNAENCSCPYCKKDFDDAREAVEELLIANDTAADCKGEG